MINIYRPRLTILQQSILRLLSIRAGTVLNQRQIAAALKVSAPAVMKAVPGLAKDDLIRLRQDKASRRWSVQLNRENHGVIQFKRTENLRLIYETGLADALMQEFAGATVILWGSYGRGEDNVNSDIDIAVIGRREKIADLSKYQRILERNLHIVFYPGFTTIHKRLRENLCNGIVLSGATEL